jgi:hypothetical protein
MKTAQINNYGLKQIASELAKHHKLGGEHFDQSMIAAWATEAENSFMDGNGCQFEISRFDSVTGRPVVVLIGEEGFDVEEVCEE